MKIWKTLALALALLLTLAACGEVGAPPAPPSLDEDYTVGDISFTEGADYADAPETFWEDGEYQYLFSAIMSHDCTVTYSNGATENIVDALEAGRVTVEDLERFDIGFSRKPVPTGIVDIRPVDGEGDTVAHALHIVEGNYSYMVGAEQYVVEYASGESESLDYAVRHGRVSVADLDRFGIPYTKEESRVDGPSVIVGGDSKQDGVVYEYVMGEGGSVVTGGDSKQDGAFYEYVMGEGGTVVMGGGDKPSGVVYEYVIDEDGNGRFVVSGDDYVLTDIDPDKLAELFPDMGEAKPYEKGAGE